MFVTASLSMFRLISLVILFSFFIWEGFSQPRPKEKPLNIVMILADDLGWADVGHESSKIDTPNLNRLAKQGIQLTSFYSSATMCSPTRAAFLTGRYPHSVGMPDLASPSIRNHVPILSLDHAAITIPEALKKKRYTSMLAGKWHLGHGKENGPRTHGFDEFWGSLIGTPGYYDVKEVYHNGTPVKVDEYFTDEISEMAIDFIERKKNGPFFLYVAYNAPHYPLEAPAALVYKYRSRFPDDGLFAIYAAMVEQMDVGIGRILKTLDSLSLTENTLVVFTSDNGPCAEPRSYGLPGAKISAGPLIGHKYSTHEGGIRVPFIARLPGMILPGTVRNEPAITMDLMPTFLELCQIEPVKGSDLHGISLVPLLMNKPFENTRVLHWEDQFNMAVRKGNWKLVHQYFKAKPSLYNLDEDMGEQNDQADRYPSVVEELKSLHKDWASSFYPKPIPRTLIRSDYIFPQR